MSAVVLVFSLRTVAATVLAAFAVAGCGTQADAPPPQQIVHTTTVYRTQTQTLPAVTWTSCYQAHENEIGTAAFPYSSDLGDYCREVVAESAP